MNHTISVFSVKFQDVSFTYNRNLCIRFRAALESEVRSDIEFVLFHQQDNAGQSDLLLSFD